MKVSELLTVVPDQCRVIISTEAGQVIKDFEEEDRYGIEAFGGLEVIHCKNTFYPRAKGGDASCLAIVIDESQIYKCKIVTVDENFVRVTTSVNDILTSIFHDEDGDKYIYMPNAYNINGFSNHIKDALKMFNTNAADDIEVAIGSTGYRISAIKYLNPEFNTRLSDKIFRIRDAATRRFANMDIMDVVVGIYGIREYALFNRKNETIGIPIDDIMFHNSKAYEAIYDKDTNPVTDEYSVCNVTVFDTDLNMHPDEFKKVNLIFYRH